jgi:hypothetical protein
VQFCHQDATNVVVRTAAIDPGRHSRAAIGGAVSETLTVVTARQESGWLSHQCRLAAIPST